MVILQWRGVPRRQGELRARRGAAHEGRFGGKLTFDFTGGGNYVGAHFEDAGNGRRLERGLERGELWLKRPEGNDFVFRYTDSAGQTFQKIVECPADRWVRVTIPFAGWTAHWGGADDGHVRGEPRMLALNLDHGLQTTGALLFDDLRLVNYRETIARVTYQAYGFEPRKKAGACARKATPGPAAWNGRTWKADFSAGARWLSLGVPDHVLLGNVDKIRLRVRGNAQGHPVRLVLRTHFMTFQKDDRRTQWQRGAGIGNRWAAGSGLGMARGRERRQDPRSVAAG